MHSPLAFAAVVHCQVQSAALSRRHILSITAGEDWAAVVATGTHESANADSVHTASPSQKQAETGNAKENARGDTSG